MIENRNIGAIGAADSNVQQFVQQALTGVLGAFGFPDELGQILSMLAGNLLLGNRIVGGSTIFGQGTNTGMLYNWQASQVAQAASPPRARRSISRRSLVPKKATAPPCPRTRFLTCFSS